MKCKNRSCSRERSVNPSSEGRCGECWLEDEEHEEYQNKWYGYWNLRGKNYRVNIEPRMYAV